VTLDDLRQEPARTPPPGHLSALDEAAAAGTPPGEVELAYMRRVLEACGGNMSEAARRLGIDRRTLYRRLAE
jgi:transcriptional regulator of acetoin/glycerol metabolism